MNFGPIDFVKTHQDANMSRDKLDKENRAVVSQPPATTEESVGNVSGHDEMQRRLRDALEDDEVREALKRLHSAKQTG